MPVTTCRAFRVDPASRFPRRRRFRFGKPNVLIIIRPVRRNPLGTCFPVGLYPCFRDRYALVGASRAGSGPERAEGRSVRARSGVPISPEVSKKSCRALLASGRNLIIGKDRVYFNSLIRILRPAVGQRCSPDGILIERLVARIGEVLHVRS